MARRVRDAILTAYLLMLIWLLVPPLILVVGSVIRPPLYFWIQPVNDWLADPSPLASCSGRSSGGCSATSVGDVRAIPVDGRQSSSRGRCSCSCWRSGGCGRRSAARRRRRRAGPGSARRRAGGVGDGSPSPNAATTRSSWKERYFAPVDRFTRLVLLPAIVVITLPLVLMTEVEGRLSRILVELAIRGSEARRFLPEDFLWMLQIDLGWYVAFWLLAVGDVGRLDPLAGERDVDDRERRHGALVGQLDELVSSMPVAGSASLGGKYTLPFSPGAGADQLALLEAAEERALGKRSGVLDFDQLGTTCTCTGSRSSDRRRLDLFRPRPGRSGRCR